MRRPEIDVHSVENGQEGEPPRDALNDSAVSILGELVNDGSEQQEVNDSPERKPNSVGEW